MTASRTFAVVTTPRTLVVVVAWLIAVAGAIGLLYAARTATGLTGGEIHATIRDAVKPTSVQLWIREARP